MAVDVSNHTIEGTGVGVTLRIRGSSLSNGLNLLLDNHFLSGTSAALSFACQVVKKYGKRYAEYGK